MGLLSPDVLGKLVIIKDPHPPSPPATTVYEGKQELTVDNVVWAHDTEIRIIDQLRNCLKRHI
jgi:hypothetical protein